MVDFCRSRQNIVVKILKLRQYEKVEFKVIRKRRDLKSHVTAKKI